MIEHCSSECISCLGPIVERQIPICLFNDRRCWICLGRKQYYYLGNYRWENPTFPPCVTFLTGKLRCITKNILILREVISVISCMYNVLLLFINILTICSLTMLLYLVYIHLNQSQYEYTVQSIESHRKFEICLDEVDLVHIPTHGNWQSHNIIAKFYSTVWTVLQSLRHFSVIVNLFYLDFFVFYPFNLMYELDLRLLSGYPFFEQVQTHKRNFIAIGPAHFRFPWRISHYSASAARMNVVLWHILCQNKIINGLH